MAEFTREGWERGLAVTLGGPWLGAKYCIPEMSRAGGGAIVFISTVNATITSPFFGNYSASKAGVNALARSIALEYGRDGIRCNAIAPGQIVGERGSEWLAKDPAEDRACRDCYPIGRYGRPEDIANVALFLASDEASFVTGITLTADGGLTLRHRRLWCGPRSAYVGGRMCLCRHPRRTIEAEEAKAGGSKSPWSGGATRNRPKAVTARGIARMSRAPRCSSASAQDALATAEKVLLAGDAT